MALEGTGLAFGMHSLFQATFSCHLWMFSNSAGDAMRCSLTFHVRMFLTQLEDARKQPLQLLS